MPHDLLLVLDVFADRLSFYDTSNALADAAPAVAGAAAAVVAKSAGAVASFAESGPPDPALGQQIFSGNCAACHSGGKNIIASQKTLEKSALEEYLDGGFNEAAVVKQVTNGKRAMPAFGGRLSDADIANVAAYVIKSSGEGWGK